MFASRAFFGSASLIQTPVDIFSTALIAFWADNFDGTNWTDEVGSTTMSELTGDVTVGSVNGHVTAVFDGASGLSAGDVTLLDGLTQFTMFGCFKASPGQNPYGALIAKLYGAVAFAVGSNSLGDRLEAAVGGNFAVNDATSDSDVFDNTWRYWYYVWDASTGGVLYVDGVAQATTEPVLEASVSDVSEPLSMGCVIDGSFTLFDYFFTGEETHVGIVNRTATAGELSSLGTYMVSILGL